MENMIEEMAPHQKFKTRKEIRKEKFGIDEDEDEILQQKIRIPRRMDHELGTPVDELHERHKSLVTDVLDRRTKKIEKAQMDLKEYDSEEELFVDVKSPAWLSQGLSKNPGRGSSKYEDRFAPKIDLKLDTLEDLLNYNPHRHAESTSSEQDFEELEKLKPKSYKSMEDPDFLKLKFKRLYCDPLKTLEDDKYTKLLKDTAHLTAKCFHVDE